MTSQTHRLVSVQEQTWVLTPTSPLIQPEMQWYENNRKQNSYSYSKESFERIHKVPYFKCILCVGKISRSIKTQRWVSHTTETWQSLTFSIVCTTPLSLSPFLHHYNSLSLRSCQKLEHLYDVSPFTFYRQFNLSSTGLHVDPFILTVKHS